MQYPDTSTAKGRRDLAILRLMWETGIRRNEIAALNVKDYDQETCTLSVTTARGRVMLHPNKKTLEAIHASTNDRTDMTPNSPLFIALDRSSWGERMTEEGFAKLLRGVAG